MFAIVLLVLRIVVVAAERSSWIQLGRGWCSILVRPDVCFGNGSWLSVIFHDSTSTPRNHPSNSRFLYPEPSHPTHTHIYIQKRNPFPKQRHIQW